MEQEDSDTLTAQIHAELSRILPIISELTGLPSNWNGDVTLEQTEEFYGKKKFSCGVVISTNIASEELRWRTLIHEALHCVSVGYVRSDFEMQRGWEEGVVEQLQRLLRPQLLLRLGVSVNEQVFASWEAKHEFNEYILALERIRQALGLQSEAREFYQELLSTPIQGRPGLVFARVGRLAGENRREFMHLFSAMNSVLKRPERKGKRNAQSENPAI